MIRRSLMVPLWCLSISASASEVILVESGDTRDTATDVDPLFTLPHPPDVFSEPAFATATVRGALETDVDVDWISFTGKGGQIIYIDSDHFPLLVDTALYLFDDAGTLLATADDSLPVDLGSELELDAFLGIFVLPADGTYYLAISSWSRTPATLYDALEPLFRPDGGEGGFRVVGPDVGNDAFVGLVEPIDLNEYTVHLTLGEGLCNMDASFASETLQLDFELATPDPVTWNVWLSFSSNTRRLWSVAIPEVEQSVPLPVPIPGFPSIGRVGLLTTFTSSGGIVCSTWKTVDTTAPPAMRPSERPRPRSARPPNKRSGRRR